MVIVAVVVCSDEAWMVISKEHHYRQAQAYLQHSSGLEAELSICLTRLKYKGLNLKVAGNKAEETEETLMRCLTALAYGLTECYGCITSELALRQWQWDG